MREEEFQKKKKRELHELECMRGTTVFNCYFRDSDSCR